MLAICRGINMKKNIIWKILLGVGVCPFIIPFILYVYRMNIEKSWTLPDWLVMYSFIYWPTYIIGLVLSIVSVAQLLKIRKCNK